jgi:hypothetical protein
MVPREGGSPRTPVIGPGQEMAKIGFVERVYPAANWRP